ncbi:MAG: hypothetical protein MUC97_12070 [Bernardetiaceae bacterium]|nr:hypothetical protein [Bernardetiaceae bacterium]
MEENYYEPKTFIMKCFETKDVVLLGEPHHIQQHLLFLNSLIPVLYKNNILDLCYEFLPYDRQNEIDQLVTGKKFDSKLAADLICSQYFEWTEKEYVDVLKTIWQVNKSGNRQFRIIGLGNSKIWDKDRFQKWNEKHWAEYVKKEVIDKNKKCIIYCGSHHSITKFQQPYYDNSKNTFGLSSKDRLGHYIYKMIGDKSMTIWLHHLWPDKNNQLSIFPCDGRVDSVFNIQKKPFAFFTEQSKIGDFTDTTSIYGKGYIDFKLKFVAEGYIVLNPICNARFTRYQELVT